MLHVPLFPRASRLLLVGLLAGVTSLPLRALAAQPSATPALTATAGIQPLDADWKFHLGDVSGAEAPAYADASWRSLELPHDWSVEGTPAANAPSAGGGGFFPTGIGWYRRHFAAPAAWHGRQVWIEFDGVYRHSEVWINGHFLGRRPSGYARFHYELTPFLQWADQGGSNVVAVRVDNSAQPNSRSYTGSGINRHVRLRIVGPVHFQPDSLFVVTQSLTERTAELAISAEVSAVPDGSRSRTAEVTIFDPDGQVVASTPTALAGPATGAATEPPPAESFRVAVSVPHPRPWSPDTPALYRAVVRLQAGDRELDRAEVRFGLRTIRVSAGRGFELNGHPLKLFGGNLHDDNGPLGTAAFDRAEVRRAELMKAAGFVAVRTAHNPPAPAFLDACDRLGLLVIDEAFDGWKRPKVSHDYSEDFDAWSERDFSTMVRRDRNHPSVVMWSIGNEPFERAKPSGAAIAHRLAARAHDLDPTRPVTAGINGPGKGGEWTALDPLFAALDVAGYNYEFAEADNDHARLPQRVIVGAESYLVDAFPSWATVQDHPFVVGDFVWSAMDYLGEAGIGQIFPPGEPIVPHWEGSHFPWHGGACGDIDLIGNRRPLSYYRAIVWDRGERLYAAIQVPSPDGRPWGRSAWAPPPLRSSWTWPGEEGRTLQVEVYSRHEAVRLYLNGHRLGEKPTTRTEEFKATFAVSYAPGELQAVGLDGGRETERFTLVTAGPAAALRLHADRTVLVPDGQDLAFVSVAVVDARGRTLPSASDRITYTLTGPAEFAALGNADLTSEENYRANPHRVFEGRALVVVRTKAGQAGEITLRATSDKLGSSSLTLHSQSR